MCKALENLMEPEIRKAKAEGIAEGIAEGEAKGRINGIYETLTGLVKDRIITVSEAARRAGESEQDFRKNAGLTSV